MRTSLIRAATVAVALCVAFPALAAYNDVTLTTDVTLSVGGVSLGVYGSSATIETITVNANNFTATLPANSSLTVQSTALNVLTVTSDTTAGISSVCTASTSTVTVAATETVNITVRPETSICGSTSSSSSGSSGSNGPIASSGGGGGGGAILPTYGTPAATAPATSASSASGLSSAQIESILGLLRSFNADQSVIDNVSASLRGGGTVPSSSGGKFPALTLPLKKGSTGTQVKTLQQMLNQDSGTRVAATGLGSPGNETTLFGAATLAAVEKFQMKWGIAKKGDAGYGSVGPTTRTKLNALYAQ